MKLLLEIDRNPGAAGIPGLIQPLREAESARDQICGTGPNPAPRETESAGLDLIQGGGGDPGAPVATRSGLLRKRREPMPSKAPVDRTRS